MAAPEKADPREGVGSAIDVRDAEWVVGSGYSVELSHTQLVLSSTHLVLSSTQ